MKHVIFRLRIPLQDVSDEMRERIKRIDGKFLVEIDDEPCLVCGHKKRLVYIDKIDGKRELVKECLYCITRIHTKANREGP